MAGDTSTWNGQTCARIGTKVRRIQGWLIGHAGDLGPAIQFIDSLKKSRLDPLKYLQEYHVKTGFTLLLVCPEGRIYEFEGGAVTRVQEKYHAIGSGSDLALGAMFVGATPVDALRAARYHNDSTSGRITKRSLT